jgi:hypothetical protein
VLAKDTNADPEVNRKRAELEAEMAAVEELIRKTFLGGGPANAGGAVPGARGAR